MPRCAEFPDLQRFFKGVDCVAHLAGMSSLPECQENPREAYDVNVSGTANVLEHARRAGVSRVLFSSTSAVYEKTVSQILREDDPVFPDLVYSMTKLSAEELCRAYAANYGMDVVACRFFNIYGPHQDILRTSPPFTSYVARELALDRAPTLFNNDAASRRDYVHAADVVDLLVRMINWPDRFSADVFNVASGLGYSVPELYETLRRIADKDIFPEYRDPGDFWEKYSPLFLGNSPLSRSRVASEVFKTAIGSNEKARATFGWQPRLGIEAGLTTVYADAVRRLQR